MRCTIAVDGQQASVDDGVWHSADAETQALCELAAGEYVYSPAHGDPDAAEAAYVAKALEGRVVEVRLAPAPAGLVY